MTDVATGFLQSVTAFGATRLGRASSTTFKDTGSLMSSLSDGVSASNKTKFDQLKADIEADVALVKPIVKAIEKQTALIAKMAGESITDANTADRVAELCRDDRRHLETGDLPSRRRRARRPSAASSPDR